MNSPEKEINNIQDLFKRLKISEDALSLEQKKFLEKNSYLKITPTNYLKKNLKILNDITSQLILNEGHKGGWEGKEKYYKKDRPFEPAEAGSLKMGAER